MLVLFRGFIYATNPDLTSCRVAYGNDILLARPLDMDTENEIQWIAEVIDTATLLVCKKYKQVMILCT